VVPILDVLFKGKILKQRELAAVVLACFGVGLLELGPSGGLRITSGDLLALSQTLFFGIGYWRLESVSHAHPHHAARLTVGQLLAVAGGAALYALTELGLGHIPVPSVDQFIGWLGDPFILCALAWTGLISTALALYLETVSLKVVSASELTLLMTTISLWGAAFAYVTIGEVLTPTGILGGVLIMGGCVVGNISPKSKNKQSLPVFREHDEGMS
jgi:drug/metabolite transporter (DMT)-like permease